jgi:apolipoprotein N-acyltransferase
VLVRDVPFVPGTTFYARHGDVFAWTCFALALALTATTRRQRQTHRGERRERRAE